METRAMKKRNAAALLLAQTPRERPDSPQVTEAEALSVSNRSSTPPNEIDPMKLYYDIFTPDQKSRHRLSKYLSRPSVCSFDGSYVEHDDSLMASYVDDGRRDETPNKNSLMSGQLTPRRNRSARSGEFLTPPKDR